MINPTYYVPKNISKAQGINAQVPFYPPRPLALAITVEETTVSPGQSFYDMAYKLFGQNGQHFWTILGDINYPELPDKWQSGERIYLPKVVIQETTT